MKLKAPSTKHGGLSPRDCSGDPEEKEISDEDDDDRNHKHRRRDTGSQSMERDSLDHPFPRNFRKRNRTFENGDGYHDNGSQASGNWRNYNSQSLERRRPGFTRDQRNRGNQAFSGESGPGRGRGRDGGSWIQRESKFSSGDMGSRMVPPGSVAPNFYGGRGLLPNVSNAQNPSWGAFGLMPGMPNGSLDTLHPIGLQGTLRPSMNLGIPRQRCRDFEERGFCLRGDICPMEHGVNRIVVEDVQSLSQFNLPAGPGPLACVMAPSTTSMQSRPVHSKSSQLGVTDDDMGLNDAYIPDLYDPDQPLWNNNGPEASAALSTLDPPQAGETEALLNDNLSDQPHVRSRYNGNSNPVRSSGSHSASSSVWGRIGSKLDAKEKIDATSSDHFENGTKEAGNPLPTSQGTSRPGKQISADDNGSKALDSTLKSQSDDNRNFRRPSQKAQRTLFVNGIPEESNKKGALLAHFSKFGEVVDIYIPVNTPRAFVQFSKREEAEAALNAPDAVMGNRFIRLWWANRDNFPDEAPRSAKTVPAAHGPSAASVPSQLSVPNRENNSHQGSDAPVSDSPRSASINGPKAPPPSQKKLETLEQMKEELRKKQELLDKKRNDFRLQLEKLAKQGTGAKNEPATEQAAKRHKTGLSADSAKPATPRPSKPGASATSLSIEVESDQKKPSQLLASPSSSKSEKPTSTLPPAANVKPGEKLTSSASMETAVSGNGESGDS